MNKIYKVKYFIYLFITCATFFACNGMDDDIAMPNEMVEQGVQNEFGISIGNCRIDTSFENLRYMAIAGSTVRKIVSDTLLYFYNENGSLRMVQADNDTDVTYVYDGNNNVAELIYSFNEIGLYSTGFFRYYDDGKVSSITYPEWMYNRRSQKTRLEIDSFTYSEMGELSNIERLIYRDDFSFTGVTKLFEYEFNYGPDFQLDSYVKYNYEDRLGVDLKTTETVTYLSYSEFKNPYFGYYLRDKYVRFANKYIYTSSQRKEVYQDGDCAGRGWSSLPREQNFANSFGYYVPFTRMSCD